MARGVDVWSLFLHGLRVSAVIGAIAAGIQVFVLKHPRATAGMINPILAGDIAILGGAMALIGIGRLSYQHEGIRHCRGALRNRDGHAFADARGVARIAPHRHRRRRRAVAGYSSTALAVGGPDGDARGGALRLRGAREDPAACGSFLNSVETREAVLTRDPSTADPRHPLDEWTCGFRRQPAVIGYGPQNATAEVRRRAAQAGMPVPGHTHLHNEFINTAVARGLFGLVALLLLLAAPVISAVSSPRDSRFGERVGFAVLLSGGYAIFGMTNLIFGHDRWRPSLPQASSS